MTDEERYLEALRQIADEPCGIPGHAVAVGCRSAWLAIMALDPECHEECSRCKGKKTFPLQQQELYYVDKKGNEVQGAKAVLGKWRPKEGEFSDVRCDWCRGSGRQMKGKAWTTTSTETYGD